MAEELGRVLVVDDSEDDHLQIRRLLGREFKVSQALTGVDALELLEREVFDALITDQKMPCMSGAGLIAQAHALPRTARLPSLLLSGRTGPEQLVDILREGQVFRYFEKDRALLSPDGQVEFVQAVRNAVLAGRLEREREHLHQRLRAQVEAVDGQYRLLRSLVDVTDPGQVLRLVVHSLAQRVRCRAALAILDLRPENGVLTQLVGRESDRPLAEGEALRWLDWAATQYAGLSGRPAPAQGTHPPGGAGDGARIPRGGGPLLPVFISRDLRGVLALVPAEGPALEVDEGELLRVWRDLLQDALTRVHTRILDERRRVELMLESMTEGVVLTDEEGSVTLINPTARRILDLAEAERADFSVVVAAMGLSSLDVLRQLAVGDSPVAWRELQRGKAYYQVLFSQVRDHAGEVIGILTVIRDVTREKLSEQRREDFVHIIGHELRSPLTSIGGILDLLGKQVLGELSARQREYVEMARDSCVRINHILNDLLDLAKFEEGKMPLTLESADLARVVAEAVRKFEAVAVDKQVHLELDCLLDGLYLDADAYRLTQVISNLLTNALKFTPAGGRIVVSVFTAYTAPQLYLVSVHNTGDEIPEDDLDRIFDKFEQVAMQDRRTLGGTGLGLSICRNIVEGHRGDIWVESGRGDGTRFVFSLPCAADQAPRVSPGVAQGPVLLVGHDLQELLALKAVLLGLGQRVRLSTDPPRDIAARVARIRPRLAIYLDVDGSGADGVRAELAAHADLPLLGLVPPGTPRPDTVDAVLELPPEPMVLSSLLNVLRIRQAQRRRLRILVVGALAIQALSAPLEEAGYLAYPAEDLDEAARRLAALLPDLVLISLDAPQQAAVRQAAQAAVPPVPCLSWGSAAQAEAAGLSPGEHLPHDADSRALRLALRARLASPARAGLDALAVLPGARELQREVQSRMRTEEAFAYCVVDLLGLDEAIERHGFMWGHASLVQIAEMFHGVLHETAFERAFLGHQRDDDFVFLVAPSQCERACEELVRAFERVAPLLAVDGLEDPGLRLQISVVWQTGGRFQRYTELMSAVTRLRTEADRPAIRVERG